MQEIKGLHQCDYHAERKTTAFELWIDFCTFPLSWNEINYPREDWCPTNYVW